MARNTALKMLVGTVAGALALGIVAASPASAEPTARSVQARAGGKAVPSNLFGMHVLSIAGAPINTGATTLRLWDAGVSWRELQPNPGAINWAPLDAAVANAQASGVSNILYVLGSTPKWAASGTAAGEVRGPGSASYPSNDAYYLDYAQQVAERYRGRINSFQVWNEADLKDFYSGTPEQLASLTQKVYKVIKAASPTASVGAAGLVPRPGRFGKNSFEDRYFRGLKKAGWPINAFVFSIYPVGPFPDQRGRYLGIARQAMRRNHAPKREIWESEANYVSKSGPFSAAVARRLVARTYIDSMSLGISRVYWFAWEQQLSYFGIMMTTPAGVPTEAAVAYQTVKGWLNGKRLSSCKNQGGVVRCRTSGGTSATIMYAKKGSKSVKAPNGTKSVCYLTGSCKAVAAGVPIRVDAEPIQVVGG